MRLTEKWRPYSRRKGMYAKLSSQSALLTMTASVGPSPNLRKRANTDLMVSMLAAIWASLSSRRDSSLPEGSPTFVVPPPISTMGLWPLRCRTRNSMMEIRLPTCRLGAVQSKPI